MFNPLSILFKYSDTISFEISSDEAQAVAGLSRSAGRPILQATWMGSAEPSLVGSVSRDNVRLHKVTPMFGNIFKPIFLGKFRTENHKVLLVGKFQMGVIAQIIVWFSMIMGLVAQIVALTSIGTEIDHKQLSLFGPTIFMGVGILVVLFCKVSARRDVYWIKTRIESTLSSTNANK